MEGSKSIPDKSINLIIADPPYFEVKGEFDFVWETFADYLKDVEKWAIECKRLLAENGTMFWWGDKKKIAYSQIIIDRYFNLENSLIWRKLDSMQYQYYSPDLARTFNTHNERLLMYSNEIDMTGLEEIKLDINNFKPLRNYFEYIQKNIGVTKKAIIKETGQAGDHCFRWGSTQWDMPTSETYRILIIKFNINQLDKYREYEELRKEYEELRKEYEELRRPFNNIAKLEEVLEFSQEGHKTKNYDHQTKKPETLTRALIMTCSRKDDLVLVPFAGSGTECAMAAKEGRRYIGFDTNEKYVKMSNKRCQKIKETPNLFTDA